MRFTMAIYSPLLLLILFRKQKEKEIIQNLIFMSYSNSTPSGQVGRTGVWSI